MENVTKIRCPYCAGKIAIEEDYYQELVGTVINCPHCGQQMIIPASVAPIPTAAGSHSLDRTQEIKMPEEWQKPFQNSPLRQQADDVRKCPYCHEEVGKRDRICISCGHKIPLQEPPAGFSQIRA